MQECKIIAIKPLEGCAASFLKVLTVDQFYVFYQEYKFFMDETGEGYEFIPKITPDLFKMGDIQINVSAVVGKNGSGKSSLVELLYAGLYNLACTMRLFKKDETGWGFPFEENIRFDLYYLVNGRIYKLRFHDGRFTKYTFDQEIKRITQQENVFRKAFLNDFFYSLVINHSQYGLNVKESGRWLKAIFHKNDAYQAPVVLNPFRDDGNIDINNENYLVRSRLLSIILEECRDNVSPEKSFLENRKAQQLIVTIDRSKFIFKKTGDINFAASNDFSHRILPVLFEIFAGNSKFEWKENRLNRLAVEYIILKLASIVVKYAHYRQFGGYYAADRSDTLRAFIRQLNEDHSHVTFKIRQAINFLVYNYLPKDEESFSISVDELSTAIQLEVGQPAGSPMIEYVPPSFLKVDIQFSGPDDTLSKFSSGEKQKVYSTASLVYHLRNIDSLHRLPQNPGPNKPKLVRYHHVNIIFDEIELYFHPEFQRQFLNNILTAIRNAGLQVIKSFNIIFVTHSPFILSDIPKENILYLQLVADKAVQLGPDQRTFGGNIHDLLATSFFLSKEGYMGEFAKQKIKSAIAFFESDNDAAFNKENGTNWNEATLSLFIASIGEKMIHDGLQELYDQKYRSVEDIEAQIRFLTTMRNNRINPVQQ